MSVVGYHQMALDSRRGIDNFYGKRLPPDTVVHSTDTDKCTKRIETQQTTIPAWILFKTHHETILLYIKTTPRKRVNSVHIHTQTHTFF